MKPIACFLAAVFFLLACGKQTSNPSGNTNNTNNAQTGSGASTAGTNSFISVFVNKDSIPVTSIHYNRGGSYFNFSAENPTQKLDVYCFWFYQQSGFNYQFSDSINYSTRPDSNSAWLTTRATNWGTVNFDCCLGPLTDSPVSGDYSGDFTTGKMPLTVHGKFRLVFNP